MSRFIDQCVLIAGLDVVICERYTSYTEMINCGPNEIIQIQETITARFQGCNYQNVKITIRNKQPRGEIPSDIR